MHLLAKLFFLFAATIDVRNIGNLHRFRAERGYRFEGRALVVCILVDRLDDLRNQVVATLQLHIDIAPRGIDAIPVTYQSVVQERDDGSQTSS